MTWRNGRMAAVAAIAMAAVLWSGVTGLAQTTPPGSGPDQVRAEAIRGTLAVIEKQLAAHGGSWEKWAEDLKPYREDIRGVTGLKWPWPAKDGYVFQGAAHALHMMDSFDNLPDGERPLEGLVHFSRQLKALGIDLIVAIIPAKMTIHPDYLYAAVEGPQRPARAPADGVVSLALAKLMYDLLRNDVEVVNLHEAFREFRHKNGDAVPLFYVRDGHYLNRGAQLAAEKIAERLKRYDFVQKALAAENPFVGEKGARTDGDKADDTLLLIKDRAGQAYKNSADSPVFVLGDSHLGYNASTAPFSGQIAYRIAVPVSEKWKEGLAAGIPVEVAKDPNLNKRRVVVVHYSERMMRPRNGEPKWPIVTLPGADQTTVPNTPIVRSAPPAPSASEKTEAAGTAAAASQVAAKTDAAATKSPATRARPAVTAPDYMGDVPGRPLVWVMGGEMVAREFGWAHFLGVMRQSWRVVRLTARDWRVSDALEEFDLAAAQCEPADAVVLSFGESECAETWMKDRTPEQFGDLLAKLIAKARTHEKTKAAAIALVTPFPVRAAWLGGSAQNFGGTASDGRSAALAEAVRKAGLAAGIPVVDMHKWALECAGERPAEELKQEGFLAPDGYGPAPHGGARCGRYVADALTSVLTAKCREESGARLATCEAQYGELERILAETCEGTVLCGAWCEAVAVAEQSVVKHTGDEARFKVPSQAFAGKRMATFVMQGADEGYIPICVMRRDAPYLPKISVTFDNGAKQEISLPGAGYGYWSAIAEDGPDRPVTWEATSMNAEGMRLRPVAGGAVGKRRWVLMTFDVSGLGGRKVKEAELHLRYGIGSHGLGPAGKGVKVAVVEGRDAWVAHGAATWKTRDGGRPWTGGKVDVETRKARLDAFLKRDLLPEIRELALAAGRAPTGGSDAAGPAAAAGAGNEVGASMVSGVVTDISNAPVRGAPYPHFLMKFYLTNMTGADGKSVGKGDGVAHVLAMHNRRILSVANTAKGTTLKLRLVPWSAVEKRYGKLQSGTLPVVQMEVEKDFYWGEIEGQPQLTEAELARVGEDDQAQTQP